MDGRHGSRFQGALECSVTLIPKPWQSGLSELATVVRESKKREVIETGAENVYIGNDRCPWAQG